MRILFTNNTLDKPAGTELSLRDAAVRMINRGHDAICFSRQLGEVAKSLDELGIVAVAELSEIPEGWEPDVIHGQHEWETSLAALRFPTVPVISFCRGIYGWQEAPCTAPNVMKYAAVDQGCHDRLAKEGQIPESSIELILNGVDMKRFQERDQYRDLPEKVLVLSNYAKEDNFYAIIREACEAEGVRCEAIGDGVGNRVTNPAPHLRDADIVFAKGKAALEACVCGAVVVVCDEPGLASECVTPENFTRMRELSFGYPLMTQPHSVETYRNRIRDYRPDVAKAVCKLARETADIERTVDRLESLYQRVIAEWRPGHGVEPSDLESFAKWAAKFFEKKTPAYKMGRECQEIWRKTDDPDHQSRYAPPTTTEAETIERHRVMDTLRKAHPTKLHLKAAEKKLRRIEQEDGPSSAQRKRWFKK